MPVLIICQNDRIKDKTKRMNPAHHRIHSFKNNRPDHPFFNNPDSQGDDP